MVYKRSNTATNLSNQTSRSMEIRPLEVTGYRVKSQRGVQFRIWATNILKEYMKKGFAMDDDRLKELGGGGYFKELYNSHKEAGCTCAYCHSTFCHEIKQRIDQTVIYAVVEITERDEIRAY